jgi:hypothetical protein
MLCDVAQACHESGATWRPDPMSSKLCKSSGRSNCLTEWKTNLAHAKCLAIYLPLGHFQSYLLCCPCPGIAWACNKTCLLSPRWLRMFLSVCCTTSAFPEPLSDGLEIEPEIPLSAPLSETVPSGVNRARAKRTTHPSFYKCWGGQVWPSN